MKKRVITLLMAFTVAFGSMAPASTAYAEEFIPAEETFVSVSSEGDEAGVDASEEASDEASEETSNEASVEASNEVSEETETEAEAQDTADEAEDAKEQEESAEASTESSTAAETENDSEEAAEAASEASSEEATENVVAEEVEEKKLVDYNFKKNVYDTETRIAADENGNVLTGWINVDIPAVKEGETVTTYEIKAVGAAALARSEGAVYYISPETKTAVTGVNTIGGKRYLFYQSGLGTAKNNVCQLARGGVGKSLVSSASTARYCVLPSGEICTGWQIIGNSEYHFDPNLGIMSEQKWIARGKGWTYVNESGRRVDRFNHSLDEDGLHYINDGQYTTESRSSEFYVFKGGVRLTGLVYFDKEDKLTTASKAAYAKYCDPVTGIVKSGFFTAGGKKYYAGTETFPSVSKEEDLETAKEFGKIKLGGIAAVDGVENGYVFVEKSGALTVNKLFTFEGKTYYAKEDGMFSVNEYRMVKGKLCHFNAKGEMDNSSVSVTGYKMSLDGKNPVSNGDVYASGKDSVRFYSDAECTQVLKNTWLVTVSDTGKVDRVYYLDKNGNAVKGIVTIDKKKYAFDLTSGKCFNSREGNEGGHKYFNGKHYLITEEGEVLTQVGFIYYGSSYYYIKNSSGQLATGLTTIKGRKYFFKGNGVQYVGNGTVTINGKHFVLNPTGRGETAYILTKKEILATINAMAAEYGSEAQLVADYMIYINSDGSLGTGWKTIKGKKIYFNMGSNVGASSSNGAEINLYDINGKLYYMEPEYGSVIKNKYLEINKDTSFSVEEVDTFISSSGKYTASKNMAFYFGSDGAAVTGFKTVNGQKYYFCEKNEMGDSNYRGMRATNTTLTIKGKKYIFDENGLISTPESEEYHYNKDGSVATGRTVVKDAFGHNVSYYHDPVTGEMEKDVIRKTGSKWYYYGYNGEQTTNFYFEVNRKECIAKFNEKDGSITGFYEVASGAERKLTNVVIAYRSDEYYFIGSNGLPATGLYKLSDSDSMDLCKTTGCSMYIDSDGDCEYRSYYSNNDYGKMLKIGSKIYVLVNGHTVPSLNANGVPIMYNISDYSSLPAADRSYLDMCSKQKYKSNNGKISVAVKTDGSVGAWTYIDPSFDRDRAYFNKYGISIESMGIFAKVGSSWYVIGDVSSASSEYLDAVDDSGNKVTLVVSWDNNLKVGKVREQESGKLANGYYQLQYSRNPVMFFSNGNIQTGKKTMKYAELNYTRTFYINPDTGWCLN